MKIVCFGDSLTSCGGEDGRFSDILQDRFPGHSFVNRGVGGEGFQEALERLEPDVLAEHADIVLVEFGANDWWRDERPVEAWAADLETIVTSVREAGTQVVILGVFGDYLDDAGKRVVKVYGIDKRGEAFRQKERELADKHGCSYVENIQERIVGRRCCWRDSNHPNEFGNRRVADAIQPVLEKLLSEGALPCRTPDLATLRDFWTEAVAMAADKLAVVDGDRRLTYGEADALVQRLAAGLLQRAGGLTPKVAVFLPNGLEYFLLYWAVIRLGGVIVPLNTWLKKDSLAGIFGSVKPDLLVARSSTDREAIDAAAAASLNVVALDPGESAVIAWETLLEERSVPDLAEIDADALCIIMHTSGTTAAPKGAMMRHSDLLFNVMTTINAHQFCASDVHLLVNPMFHCTALYSSLPTAAYTKTPVVITTPTKPERLMELVQEEGITTFLSIPSVFQQVLKIKDPGRYDASSLRVMAYAGSPMPVRTIHKLQERFPDVALHNFFGLTETISMTHVLRGEEAEERSESIGKLLPFVDARVVDETGQVCAPGEAGELLFARENVIPGYYGQSGRLEESIMMHDGREWFRTGDVAMVDEEGYFFIKGRKKDMIIVGGENVYAVEIEALLLAHEKVQEAAVKGETATGASSFLGEILVAYVVPGDETLTEAELRRYCYEKLPSYKVPRKMVFVAALPRNATGKVVKAELGK